MFCSASLAAAAVVAIIGVAEAGIGPGRTGWQSVQAEKFGINSTKLEAAAAELHDAAAVRNCTLIVKDGYIIHESYDSWSNAESLFESDSMGKTAIAAVIGIAEYKGLLDIDEPVAKYYNDDSRASWNQSGTNFFPKVTLRHILSQASGYGRVEPGSFFTYDSEDYIMYLSYVIGAVTGEEPVVWATRELADPLGVGSLFMFDGLPGGDFSSGGGQLYSCRDAARVGQLIANGGMWADGNGMPMRMLSAEFAEGFFKPSFPKINAAYGFLTWLNTEVEKWGVSCCAPRWGHAGHLCATPAAGGKPAEGCASCCQPRFGQVEANKFCNTSSTTLNEAVAKVRIQPGEPQAQWMERVGSAHIDHSMIGDNIGPGLAEAPYDFAIAMGLNARYIMSSPSTKLTIISLGSSRGWATSCWLGYDDAYTVALVWNTVGAVVAPACSAAEAARRAGAGNSSLLSAETEAAVLGAQRRHAFDPDPRLMERDRKLAARQKAEASAGVEFAGSCTCYCKAESGRGACFNTAVAPASYVSKKACESIPHIKDANNTNSFLTKQGDYCSPLGYVKQCIYPTDATNTSGICSETQETHRLCAPVSGLAEIATQNCITRTDTWDGKCVWSNSTCQMNMYFKPGDDYLGPPK